MALLWVLAALAVLGSQAIEINQECVNRKGSIQNVRHEQYCSLFYQCLPDNSANLMMCGEGTIWDDRLGACLGPGNAQCTSYQCTRAGQNFPDLCCDKYWTCLSAEGGYSLQTCGTNLRFDRQRGVCDANVQCVDDKSCVRYPPSDGEAWPCPFRKSPRNPCKFAPVSSPQETQLCGHGQAFNDNDCSCSVLNSTCNYPNNHVLDADPECRADMELSFFTDTANFVNRKTNQPLPYYVQVSGYQGNTQGSQAILSNTGYLYIPYFNNNELRGPFVMVVKFKPNSFSDRTYTLVENEYYQAQNPCSDSRLTLTVRSSGNSHTVSLTARFTPASSGTPTQTAQDSMTLNTQSSQSFVEVHVRQDSSNLLSLAVMDRGSLGTSPISSQVPAKTLSVVPTGPLTFTNGCGLTVGRGLDGTLAAFNIHHGCGDLDRAVTTS